MCTPGNLAPPPADSWKDSSQRGPISAQPAPLPSHQLGDHTSSASGSAPSPFRLDHKPCSRQEPSGPSME
ncbi:hypothetical protein E2C01_006778 [Portunus trituberculatus]|uniref:Uncharacterized protein n=1 Tax=Portunus trituberculatus TaxID=210409 RepID=A0A5B7D0K5_PORTR|nr:hypothetical protein [Portunus trituberculatus]